MAFIKKIKRKWQGREKWSVTAVTQGSPVSLSGIANLINVSKSTVSSEIKSVNLHP